MDLAVRLKSGQDTGCVEIIKKLPAELHIELSSELIDPFANMFRLDPYVFLVIKTDLIHFITPICTAAGTWHMRIMKSFIILPIKTA